MSIFMQFEGIKGEVSDKGHKAWLDVANIEWAVERRITEKSSTRHDRESANAEISSLILSGAWIAPLQSCLSSPAAVPGRR